MNLQQLDKLEFYFGCGKVVKEDLNYTLHKYQPKRLSLKLFSFPTHHKLFQEPKKES